MNLRKNAQECEAKECSKDFSACMGEVKAILMKRLILNFMQKEKILKQKMKCASLLKR